MPENALLFVYGTLRRGFDHPMQTRLERAADYLGRGRVMGRLYDAGGYPGIVITAGATQVVGDIFRLHDPAAAFARLDRYEGCDANHATPHEYRREQHPVTRDDGSELSVWVYVYQRAVDAGMEIVSGDYLAR